MNNQQSGAGTVLDDPRGIDDHGEAPRRQYNLSIDTGGTFTDGFVSDGTRSAQVKVDTTPHDLTVGFQACVAAAAEAVGESLSGFLSSMQAIHFSSTIATNTIVERRGARVGLIVTAGAEEHLYGSEADADALRTFVTPELVRGVAEETTGDGRVARAPSAADVEVAVRELLERGVRLLVISFANAHLNDDNELAARQLINDSYPRHYLGAVPLMVSSRVSLAAEDHGRTAMAVVNAYLHPNLVRALYRAEDQARERGLRRPLLIVNTDGSTSRVAKTRAIDTYNSGPSAGVLGSAYVAEALDAHYVCTLDVGGTTTDVAYIAAGRAQREARTEVGSLHVPHPAVALHTFGLGGGSIISVDGDRLVVGPESAGAAPGPACFGLGGAALTPTDVWLLLGYLEPGEFLGGRRTLDPQRAEAAAATLADRLGLSAAELVLEAAAAIRRTLSEHLGAWARRHSQLIEAPAKDRWLFSYGGGGGLLCTDAADALDVGNVVVFPHSSVFSAFGGSLLPIAHSYQSVIPGGASAAQVGAIVGRLADNARRDLRAEGATDLAAVTAVLWVGAGEPRRSSLADLLDRSPEPGEPTVEPTVCRLSVTVERTRSAAMLTGQPAIGERDREIVGTHGSARVPIIGGLGQRGATPSEGPAFVEAPDTTVYVPKGWSIAFTDHGYGVMTRMESA